MKIEINVDKKAVLFLVSFIIGIVIIGAVIAFTVGPGTVPNPGHSLSTIQGYFAGDATLEDSLFRINEFFENASCAEGSVISTINPDGTVTCEENMQQRVFAGCDEGSSIRVINEDGGVICETDDTGGGGETRIGGGSDMSWLGIDECPGGVPNSGDGYCNGDNFACLTGERRLNYTYTVAQEFWTESHHVYDCFST